MKYYLIRVLDTATIGCDDYVELTKEELKAIRLVAPQVYNKIRKVLK